MSPRSDRTDGKRSMGKKSTFGGLAVIVLLGIYSFAAPQLNARYGWNLPQLKSDAEGNIRVAESPPAKSQSPRTGRRSEAKDNPKAKENSRDQHNGRQPDSDSELVAQTQTKPKSQPVPAAEPAEPDSDGDLLYGLLREVAKDRYVSPSGLLFTPGSAEGHRLEHLRRHIKDDPGRPGPHGVFDGKMEGALATIDQAYDRAKKGQRATKRTDDDRTIYTVDMGRRVGFVGGREGARRREPMARRVRIVVEGNRFITAYPM